MAAQTQAVHVPRRRSRRFRFDPWALIMVLPGLTLFAIFMLWPLVNAFANSLFSWDGLGPKVFAGVQNYEQIFTSSQTYQTLEHTAIYAIGTGVAKVVLAFLIALLVARRARGVALFRSVIFIPVLMSFVAVGVLWTFILDPNQGLLNGTLGALGLPHTTPWLGQPGLALCSVMAVDVWKWLGYHVILFVAGLQAVRPELYEAAKVDGAGRIALFFHVTVPSMRTMIGLNLIIAIAGGFNVFDLVYVMTKGGPDGSTDTVMTFMYRQAFDVQQYGFASALASVSFVVVAVVTLIQIRLLRSDYNA
ncbi:carbohydrate ABC transporter permease [Nocardia sp. CWNU-33]|uniref:carbohydrate ABC transporter permease n=1 Tax=Nocardia sp. CWNU-33 TaxID=3392117 RepID=UPI00398F2142